MALARKSMEGSRYPKTGYMEKEGTEVKSWKKRWFRLTGETLGYYKDEKSKSPLGEFEIRVDLQLVENTANEINFEIITFDREDPMLIKAPNAQV